MLHRRQHDVTHHLPTMPARGRYPAHRFTVAAIQREGHAQRLAIVAAEFKAVRTPALIASGHGDLAIVATSRANRTWPARKQQSMRLHDAIDPLRIHRRHAGTFSFASQ